MDTDRLVRQTGEQVAARPSRRGIVSAVAKLAVGAGSILAGLRGPSEATAKKIGDSCCSGPRPCKKPGACDHGTKRRYSWFCTTDGGARFLCQDCVVRINGRRRHICTYTVPQGSEEVSRDDGE